jgi:hypothetical protein
LTTITSNASTTGVPAGTSLTAVNGDFTSSYAGQIIDGLSVHGTITVDDPGVIIRNCQAANIFVTETGTNSTIENSEVVGLPTWNSGITILADNGIVRGCDISGVERGIWLESNNSLVENNYFHNLINNTGTSDPHIDGIQIPGQNIPGGSALHDIIIRDNNLDLAQNISSAVTMRDATNVDLYNNQLSGGTYIIYFEGNTTGSNVTDNVFGAHLYGYVAGTAVDSQTFSGNVYGDAAVSTGTAPSGSTSPASSPPASVSTDSGTVVAAGVTSDNTSTPDGTAAKDGSTQVGPATADPSGSWEYIGSVLTNATHLLTKKALASTGTDDLLGGHGGHDTFVFAPNFGHDVMKDFAASESQDGLHFSKCALDSFADVLAHATQSGHDVVMPPDAGALNHVKLAALDKIDFHFA